MFGSSSSEKKIQHRLGNSASFVCFTLRKTNHRAFFLFPTNSRSNNTRSFIMKNTTALDLGKLFQQKREYVQEQSDFTIYVYCSSFLPHSLTFLLSLCQFSTRQDRLPRNRLRKKRSEKETNKEKCMNCRTQKS